MTTFAFQKIVIMRIYIFISIILISTSAYTQDSSNELHRVTVKESIQTNSYTYLLVEENDSEWWVAAPKMTPVSNAVYYYLGEMKIKNFHSKELDRDFESVTFVEDLVFEEIYQSGKYPVEGGVTIANLFINKDEYETLLACKVKFIFERRQYFQIQEKYFSDD